MATIKEILQKSPEERRKEYGVRGTYVDKDGNSVARHIDKVTIDGNVFTDYSAFSFLWEKSYVREPTRSGDGTIGNLNSYATFLTPHLKINFSMMSIDDYRTIMTLIEEKNEFLVSCYDVVHNKTTTNYMYFTTEEMPKLFALARALNGEEYVELLGVEDYTVEMVGTNKPKELINVVYYGLEDIDGNRELLTDGSISGVKNTEFIVGEGIVVPDKGSTNSTFNNQWKRELENGNFKTYVNNEEYRLSLLTQTEIDTRTIVFYAVGKSDTSHTLLLSYGLGSPYKDKNGNDITAIDFVQGDTIGRTLFNANISLWEGGVLSSLPTSPNPTIIINKVKYDTHIRKGWYETATIPLDEYGNPSQPLNDNSKLLVNGNMTIYQIFEPVKHSVTFNSNSDTEYTPLSNVAYGVSVPLPTPYQADYTFVGWFTDSSFTTKFDGSMPPYDLTLYAKWEEISK